eukprot:Gregarina_sp_Poly_1__10411@NODE_74_length_15926_cov_73_224289_g63_i0_p3_GENE_NODE_74_length_15926_cov_73_224289_g63_i0NODE_74_length_15926_cov_73_224289_g63_i0_p3_ORF_typecomplete_len561_score30_23Rft1/PF04506_13/9_2e36DUF420/PF04238_12/17DUF420/PF04238_12/1_2_NODE_74_length_15926_cov_73_224289_g63_i076589340
MSAHNIIDTTKGLFGRAALPRIANVLVNFVQLAPLDWYGLHSINLAFFITLTEWLRTQCFRKIILRYPGNDIKSKQARHNLCRIGLYSSLLVISLVSIIYWNQPPSIVQQHSYYLFWYQISLALHTIAAVVASLSDLPYIELCNTGNHGLRIKIETTCALVHSCSFTMLQVIALALKIDRAIMILVASGLAQIGWSLSFLILCARGSNTLLRELMRTQVQLPEIISTTDGTNSWLTSKQKEQVRVELAQSVQKWFMSEADKLLMMRYFSDTTKGAVSLTANLCGVALRLLFQPQEDMLSVHYSGMKLHEKMKYDDIHEWFSAFRVLSLAEWSVGLAAALFAPIYGQAILTFIYGPKIGSQHVLFGRYGTIVYLFSLNGIMEGLLTSSGGPQWQWRHLMVSRIVWAAGIVGAVVAWELLPRGVVEDGTIWMLCTGIGLLGRLITPCWYITHYLQTVTWSPQNDHQYAQTPLFILAARVAIHEKFTRIGPTYLAAYLISRILLYSSFNRMVHGLDEYILDQLPHWIKPRLMASHLALGAIVGTYLLVALIRAIEKSSKNRAD